MQCLGVVTITPPILLIRKQGQRDQLPCPISYKAVSGRGRTRTLLNSKVHSILLPEEVSISSILLYEALGGWEENTLHLNNISVITIH